MLAGNKDSAPYGDTFRASYLIGEAYGSTHLGASQGTTGMYSLIDEFIIPLTSTDFPRGPQASS